MHLRVDCILSKLITKNMKKELRNAFSFLESVVVIAIIGILIIAIMQSVKLVRKIKLNSAQTLTSSSEVSAIPNMSIWLETTIFKNLSSASRASEVDDVDSVKSWNDYNTQAIEADRLNALQSNVANQPLYVKDGISGLPALRFDGVNDYLSVRNFAANSVTIFVVLKTDKVAGVDSLAAPVLWAGAEGVVNDISPVLINKNNPSIANGGDSDYFLTADRSVVTDSTHIVMVSRNLYSGTREIWVDSINVANDTNGAPGVPLNANLEILIGRNPINNVSFNGYIGEIIAFERNLEIAERKTVERYLAKKWKVKIAGD